MTISLCQLLYDCSVFTHHFTCFWSNSMCAYGIIYKVDSDVFDQRCIRIICSQAEPSWAKPNRIQFHFCLLFINMSNLHWAKYVWLSPVQRLTFQSVFATLLFCLRTSMLSFNILIDFIWMHFFHFHTIWLTSRWSGNCVLFVLSFCRISTELVSCRKLSLRANAALTKFVDITVFTVIDRTIWFTHHLFVLFLVPVSCILFLLPWLKFSPTAQRAIERRWAAKWNSNEFAFQCVLCARLRTNAVKIYVIWLIKTKSNRKFSDFCHFGMLLEMVFLLCVSFCF